MKTRHRFLAGFGLAALAVAIMGQVGLTTMPPGTVFGRIGVGAFGPGGAVPLSTLAANLGVGVTAHSVVIGKGTTTAGFNGAPPVASGAILIDQGLGNDAVFTPVSGSCTLAANGAISCSGVGGGVTSVTANYAALPGDCLKTIAVSGGSQITLTVNSAATYGACTLDITNNNAWASPAGVILAVTGLTTNPAVLYPGMTITLTNISGAWAQKPNVVIGTAPLGTKLYVDGVNGLDTNDCLAAATACQTLNHVIMGVLFNNLEVATSGSGTGSNASFDIRLINDAGCAPTTGVNCIHGLHMSSLPRRTEGHNSIMIECDGGSATNCTIADNGGAQAIGVYCACNVEIKNVTLAGGTGNNNAIQVEKGMVRLEGGVVLTGIPLNAVGQLSAIEHGSIIVEGGTTLQISGGAAYFAESQYHSHIQLDQATIQWTATSVYTSTLAAFAGLITANGTTWTTGGFASGTNKLQCSVAGFIDTGGGVASVPGTTTTFGCANSANGTYN
jgi:hypothetical protein